jgi:hypothetical protein
MGYNFTSPVSQNGDTDITQWGVNGGLAGVSLDGAAADGAQIAFIQGGTTIYQDLGALSPYTTYHLSLFAQQSNDTTQQGGMLTESLATGPGGQKDSIVDTGALTVGSSATVSLPTGSLGAISPLYFTTGASVSGDLYVLLTDNPAGKQIYVDDVVVSTVPEPSTTAFLGLTALSLVGYRLVRRRRKS